MDDGDILMADCAWFCSDCAESTAYFLARDALDEACTVITIFFTVAN